MISQRGVGRLLLAGGAVAIALMVLIVGPCIAQSTDREAPRRWERSTDRAETPSREILLGTVTTHDRAALGRQREAEENLADARDALDRGDVMLARRRLEMLLETFPETPAAKLARDQLMDLSGPRRSPVWLESAAVERRARQPEPIPQSSAREAAAARDFDNDEASTFRRNRSKQKEEALRQRQRLEDERRLEMLGYRFQMAAGDRVFFAETSADLGSRARLVLAAQARWLAQHDDLPVVIEAHADDYRGNRELDIQLSQKRAQIVRERLVEEGVDPARIIIHAFGRDRPVAICQAPECASQNRRVITRLAGAPDAEDGSRRAVDEPALATAPRQRPRGGGN
ncbi:MAG: OmpA family protein [Hyphomicrobiales bacterium]|nr:OmpA family protein [Hyphomicrobiales bacterium]